MADERSQPEDMAASVVEVPTTMGPARVHRWLPEGPRGSLVLTHGANGRLTTNDLQALRRALLDRGWAVALVEQAFVVAGRRIPPRPPTQDAAWVSVMDALRDGPLAMPQPMIIGGRSNGARVACRTAARLDAAGVLGLAFPLHPPRQPEKSRADDLAQTAGTSRPVLIIQGRNDPFGTPEEIRYAAPEGVEVVQVRGGHGFARDPDDLVDAVLDWLDREWPTSRRR
ncbi:MAG: alpha/beta family hydrolase [Nostocoides sp.]